MHMLPFKGNDQPEQVVSETKIDDRVTVNSVAIAVSRYYSEIKIFPTVYCSAIITVVVTSGLLL